LDLESTKNEYYVGKLYKEFEGYLYISYFPEYERPEEG
jgi:hypothetical protein